MTDRRRAAIVTLLVLVAGGLVLAPLDLATIRLAGVGLLWWYAIVVAPFVAALVVALSVVGRRG